MMQSCRQCCVQMHSVLCQRAQERCHRHDSRLLLHQAVCSHLQLDAGRAHVAVVLCLLACHVLCTADERAPSLLQAAANGPTADAGRLAFHTPEGVVLDVGCCSQQPKGERPCTACLSSCRQLPRYPLATIDRSRRKHAQQQPQRQPA